ncbi:MAG: AAA family ATPase, partial [Bacteroidota bacterium]
MKKPKHALVLGKFMPLHAGHQALITFALSQARHVIVLLCVEATEPIAGSARERWLRQTYPDHPRLTIRRIDYQDEDLPATSVSSRSVSALWTQRLKEWVPTADVIVGSEDYVRYVAEIWGIGFQLFEPERESVPISATMIRQNPYRHRHFLAPAAKPDFVQRIVLHGTESTGKSTLTEHLANVYQTAFVPETAREIVAHTDTVIYEDLVLIADRQAEAIQAAIPRADGVLFIDTDVYTTLAYSRYLFGRELPLSQTWLVAAQNDLCLYTQADAPYVQDGTRL